MESAWDPSVTPSETTPTPANGQAPVVDEDSLIGSNRHIRYVLGQQPSPPPVPDPDPVVPVAAPVDRPSGPNAWQVAALLTFTFILGTACCFFILRGLNRASADTQTPHSTDSAAAQATPRPAPMPSSSDPHTPPAPFNSAVTRAFPTMSATLAVSSDPGDTYRSGAERAASPAYSIVDLGPVAPISGMGQGHLAINGHGDVAFTSHADGEKHAWLWSHGRREEIIGLGGKQCEVRALNDLGGAAGFAEVAGSTTVHAFFRHKGVTVDLGNLAGGDSFGLGMNDRAQVVGTARVPNGDFHAFVWDSQTGMLDLNSRTTGSAGLILTAAYAISEDGRIVGSGRASDNSTHAFLWSHGKVADLGVYGRDSYASGLNARGDVVGTSFSGQRFMKPFLNSGSTVLELSTKADENGVGLAVNGKGEVVGSAGSAAIWDIKNGRRDLNSLIPGGLGWALTEATDINDAGQIVGFGLNRGELHGFLLDPVSKR